MLHVTSETVLLERGPLRVTSETVLLQMRHKTILFHNNFPNFLLCNELQKALHQKPADDTVLNISHVPARFRFKMIDSTFIVCSITDCLRIHLLSQNLLGIHLLLQNWLGLHLICNSKAITICWPKVSSFCLSLGMSSRGTHRGKDTEAVAYMRCSICMQILAKSTMTLSYQHGPNEFHQRLSLLCLSYKLRMSTVRVQLNAGMH